MAIHLHSDAPLGDYLYPADETRRAAVSEVADWRIGKSLASPRLASPSTAQSCSGTEFTQNKRGYAPATINFRLAAVRRVAYEAADAGLLSPELAAGIRRVKGVRRIGVRLGNRLTPEEGRQQRWSPCSSAADFAERLALASSPCSTCMFASGSPPTGPLKRCVCGTLTPRPRFIVVPGASSPEDCHESRVCPGASCRSVRCVRTGHSLR